MFYCKTIRILIAMLSLALFGAPGHAESNATESAQSLKPVPSSPDELRPLNFASKGVGATLLSLSPDGRWVDEQSSSDALAGNIASNFLGTNPAKELQLAAGKHEFLLILGGLRKINRLSARLKGEGSSLRAYIADAPYALDSSRWKSLPGAKSEGSSPIVGLDFPLSSAQCVRLSVDLPKGGKFGSLAVLGDVYVDSSTGTIPAPDQWDKSQERVEYDFARLSSGGRVAYVESGYEFEAFNILDDDLETTHKFDVVDKDAFFIVELAENYPVYSASLITTEPVYGAEIWTFSEHPVNYLAGLSNSGRAGELNLAKQELANRKPSGRVTVSDEEDGTLLTMPLPDSRARYMLVRVIGRKSAEPIEVSTFSVLGRVPRDVLPGFSLESLARSPRPEVAESAIVQPPEIIDPPFLPPVSP